MNREAILTALLDLLVGSLVTNFTGDTAATDPVIANMNSTEGLFLGLPVFGPGIRRGAVVDAIGSDSITLSQPASADGTASALTSGFQTTGRRLKHWSQISAFPAMFLRDGDDDYPAHNDMVYPKPLMEPEIWIYSNLGENPDVAPSIGINRILNAIEAVLAPTTNEDTGMQQLSLGGLCQHCWIEGRIAKDPGDLDGIAKAVMPLKILAPD